MTIYLRLFYEFFKIGLFSVGGGLATLPFLYTLSAKTGWFSINDLLNMVAVSESTPGAIGINISTYVGFTTKGIPGAILATFSLALPAIIIIIIVSKFLEKFKDSKIVKDIFYGILPASTALIAAAGIGIVKVSLFNLSKFHGINTLLQIFNYKAIILALLLFIVIKKTKKHPLVYIAASAIIGVIFSF